MKYVESCKPVNEAVANAYEIASKAAGVPMKVLKATIKQRELQRKIEGIPEKFEDETRETFDMVCQALGDFGDTPLGGAAKDRAAKADGKTAAAQDAEEPKKPRGRPRKAPSPDATSTASSSAAAAPAGLDPDAASDVESLAFKAGFDARMAAKGGAIPTSYEGPDRDSWHGGWLAADKKLADGRAAEENATRLGAGISPLH